jgi:hypothetical protein
MEDIISADWSLIFFVCYYSTGDCGGEEEKEEVVLASPALHLQKKISTPLLVYNLHLLFFLFLFYTLISDKSIVYKVFI